MNKPDRFEQLAIKAAHGWDGNGEVVGVCDVASLLRREHAAVVRLVKKALRTTYAGGNRLAAEYFKRGSDMATRDILEALRRRKEGR